MEILTLLLLLLAYTLGIATLIVQIICYIRKIEYLETILLVVSFLVLLMLSFVMEFNYLTGQLVNSITEGIMYFFTVVLACIIALNTHRERILNKRVVRNKWTLWLSVVMVLFLVAGYLLHFEKVVRYGIFAFLNLSIFCIIFCLLKLPDDIIRLTMFGPRTKINPVDLSNWNISAREKEVIELLMAGESYRNISEKLFISMPTVKTHVSHIYQKLNVRNKVELVNLVKGSHTKV